jgi:hypothetical protein
MPAISPRGFWGATLGKRFAPANGERDLTYLSRPGASQHRSSARATSTARAILPWLGVVALLVAGGAYYKRDMLGLSSGEAPASASQAIPPDPDPVVRFNETRIGHLLFMLPDGRTCRRVLFDNVSGSHVDAGRVECAPQEPSQSGAVSAGRFDAIRNSFKR